MRRLWNKWRERSRPERALLLQTLALLCAARIALKFQSMQQVSEWLCKIGSARIIFRSRGIESRVSREQIGWAVNVVSARVLGDGTCLTQALTARQLLQVNGYPAELRIGVAKQADGKLAAHAWVESEGEIVIGGTAAELAAFSQFHASDDVMQLARRAAQAPTSRALPKL